MSISQSSVAKLYASVIEDVIGGVREYFMDEGVDEQVLMDLKQIWETRLKTTKAVEPNKPEPEPQPPQLKNVQKTTAPTQTSNPGMMPVDFNRNTVAIHLTIPSQQGVPDAQPRVITIQAPQAVLQGDQLQTFLSSPVVAATMALPQNIAASVLQQHVTAAFQGQAANLMQTSLANGSSSDGTRQVFSQGGVPQVDGVRDSSDEDENEEDEDNEDDDDEDEDDKEEEEDIEADQGVEEEPLNSGDDVSDDDTTEMFETDNVVVCQYDKITRSRNKWKFHLKDGIMNLGGKDYVFQKSTGDAEW